MDLDNNHTEERVDPLYRNIFSVARIGGYAAILSLAGSIAGAVAGFNMKADAMKLPVKEGFEEADMQQLAQGSIFLFITASIIISVITFYFLFRFSKLSQSALLDGDKLRLAEALKSLSGYFKTWGILLFLIMLFLGLTLLGGIFNGATGAG